ncbi:MAG: DUF1697 domain-containing protein [Actinomycetota bacterium]|nr:DUF1697 domain-containing protein [Actinomycetota bacterium]
MASGVQYLGLLRGINVGGKNLVRMSELREALEGLGLADVRTYIQSGNFLFRAPRQSRKELAGRLEAALSRKFGLELKLVLLTQAQLKRVVAEAPRGFGSEAERCDVIFLRAPLTVKRALAALETREGVDRMWPGTGAVYYSRLAERASSSRMGRVVARPEYQDMTIRSWGTVGKLAALMEEPG